MRLPLILFFTFLGSFYTSAQVNFKQAYANNPNVPEGLLEAVAWTNTHMVHLQNEQESCSGIPQAYGILGLHDDGKNYFVENGIYVESLSGISVLQQRSSPEHQLLAYATAFNTLMIANGASSSGDPIAIRQTLLDLSEIPDSGFVNLLARDLQVYQIMNFMRTSKYGITYGFSPHHFDLPAVFGSSNYSVLSSQKIRFTESGILGDNGLAFAPSESKSLEYGPAIWDPAAACNFSSRNGVAVSAITIHTIQGTYAGAISWAQNCASGVSYHYVIRSSDGQVTQMVNEADKGWHVGSENPYTIGYEHEGYVNDPSWYTEEMYNSSADLSRDIINSGYGIPGLRTYYGPSSVTTQLLGGCTKIKGHQHFANQTHTDPGINWDWEKYYRLINNTPTYTSITSSSGTIFDTGGSNGNYQDDERELWLIEPANVSSITLDFSMFDLELDYDNLFIYDGDSVGDILLGSFTGSNLPPSITSSGGTMLLEFRSDCGTTANGWEASYTSVPVDVTAPITVVTPDPNWKTMDFPVNFVDSDNESGILERYYNVAEKLSSEIEPYSNGSYGFLREGFETTNNWTSVTSGFSNVSESYLQSDTSEQNSNSYSMVTQDNNNSYLYEWNQSINGSGSNQRAGLHFFCDDPTLSNRGNSYFVYFRANDKVQIYSVTNDVYNLEEEIIYVVSTGQYHNCRVSYAPNTGVIKVYLDGIFVGDWQDPTPLVSGNSISLRTGGTEAEFDDVRVYKLRGNSENISVGSGQEFNYESEGAIPTGYVSSIVLDSVHNWSIISEESFLVDYSNPTIDFLYDGVSNDIDTFETSTIYSNWLASDIHSDISNYEIAIGTLPNLDNVVPWTSNGAMTSYSTLLTSPIYNQVYHVSVRVFNGAGLNQTFVSDGQRYIDDLSNTEAQLNNMNLFPNPATNVINFTNAAPNFDVIIYDSMGKECIKVHANAHSSIDVSQLAQGAYNVIFQIDQSIVVKKLIIQ